MRHTRSHKSGPRRRGFWARVRYAFRERQIYLRSEGEVQFITLRPWVQVICVVLLFSGLFWLAFASVNVTFKDQLLALKERRLYQARLDYEDRIATMRTAIDGMNNRLLLNQDEYLAKVDKLRSDYEALVERHQRLGEFFRQGWLPARNVDDIETGSRKPAASPGDEAGTTPSKGSLNRWTYQQLHTKPFTTKEQAEVPLEDLKKAMDGMESLQVALLSEVAGDADEKIVAYGKLFKKLGLDAKAIAQKSTHEPSSVGGPFVSITATDIGSAKVAAKLTAAARRLVLAEKLRFELSVLPLYSPLDKVSKITSRYGLRRDPFKRGMAMHSGIDLKAPYGSPVRTTSDGVVVKAGWEGAYGRLVEIRHDNGIRSNLVSA
jgi:murein DD-endopeptidase MepM/ murein hydrolase activator NlpD